jgi:hypothetical protein
MTWGLGIIAIASMLQGGTVIDQIAVVVGKHAIKTSDLGRDLRVTQFLNGQPPDASVVQKRMAVERLIDQELIRSDLAQSGNATRLTAEAKAVLDQLRAERFQNSENRMTAELGRRGLSAAQLLDQLQWQLVVLRFIDQRFRPGVIVSDEEVRAYYEQHATELKRQYPGNNTPEDLMPRIREIVEGERINRNFEDWLQQARKTVRIEYKLGELQ